MFTSSGGFGASEDIPKSMIIFENFVDLKVSDDDYLFPMIHISKKKNLSIIFVNFDLDDIKIIDAKMMINPAI